MKEVWPFSGRTFDELSVHRRRRRLLLFFALFLSLNVRYLHSILCWSNVRRRPTTASFFSFRARSCRRRCWEATTIPYVCTCVDEWTMSSMAKNEFRTLDDKWSLRSLLPVFDDLCVCFCCCLLHFVAFHFVFVVFVKFVILFLCYILRRSELLPFSHSINTQDQWHRTCRILHIIPS